MIRIALLMKDKPVCHLAYQWCRERYKNIAVAAVVMPEGSSISSITEEELVNKINNGLEIDLIVSFLYWKRIGDKLLRAPKQGCINFHPAPLPNYKGVAPYTKAIMDGVDKWGVTAHFMDEKIDNGDIISVRYFPIDVRKETAYSLSSKTSVYLLDLFKDVMANLYNGKEISRTKQSGGSYFSMKDFERLRQITDNDSFANIEQKTRAFWHPPHEGAYVMVNGQRLFVIPRDILRSMGGVVR